MDQKRMAQLEQDIENWIASHRDAMVADISRLVKIRSVSDAEHGTPESPFGQGCRDALEEMLKIGREHGFTVKNHDNRVGSLCLTEGKWEDTIGFWGHLDVVPEGSDWDYAPYEPLYKDGYLIGRGSQDNKGPTVAVMYVIKCLSELGVTLRHPLKLFVGCDEEKGMSDLEYYTAHYPCPGMSMIADCGFPVCYGEKGIIEANLVSNHKASGAILSFEGGVASNMVPDTAVAVLNTAVADAAKLRGIGEQEGFTVSEADGRLTITAKGVSKHTAFPKGGVNAIHQLSTALAQSGALPQQDVELLAFMNQVNQDFAGTGLNIVYADEVSGALTCVGSMASMRDGHLVQHLNIRYSITADSEQLLRNIAQSCEEKDWTMELIRDSKPNYFPKEHPAVDLLTGVFNEMTGQERTAYVMGGGTYARKLPHAFAFGMGGVPGSPAPEGLFRPGHGGAHGPDEGLDIGRLLIAMKIYCIALIRLDQLEQL